MTKPDKENPLPTDNTIRLRSPRVETTQCPHCGREMRYMARSQQDYYSDPDVGRKYIKAIENNFDSLIDELQEMFPSTPIREYMDAKAENVLTALRLMKKGMEGKLSFKEECQLQSSMKQIRGE